MTKTNDSLPGELEDFCVDVPPYASQGICDIAGITLEWQTHPSGDGPGVVVFEYLIRNDTQVALETISFVMYPQHEHDLIYIWTANVDKSDKQEIWPGRYSLAII